VQMVAAFFVQGSSESEVSYDLTRNTRAFYLA
jgi:hypothetical protein